jgi:hypothetical protein
MLLVFGFAAIIGLAICISRKNINVGKKKSENITDILLNLDAKV